jgi:hypothetical protein
MDDYWSDNILHLSGELRSTEWLALAGRLGSVGMIFII